MKRLLLLAALASAATLTVATPPAHAQIAAAMGRPLPAPDLNPGDISVRVIAGSVASPVIGVDVTMVVNGTPRVARTDSAGRAWFKGLSPGSTVKASVKGEDGNPVESTEFQVASEGGAHVMLTTRPLEGGGMGGGGAPFAGGGMGGAGAAGGMPDPRNISGVARPEQKNAPGTLTVRVTYDDLTDKAPNIPVTLVAYGADGSILSATVQTDAAGHAKFDGLDVSGATAYYALALVPRNGTFDRLVSAPVIPDPQVGVAVMLSSDKLDAKTPPIDDQGRLDPQEGEIPAGKVRVPLEGEADPTHDVTLVDVVTHKPVAHAKPVRGAPDPSDVKASADFKKRPDENPGTFDMEVRGGGGSTPMPLPNLEVAIYAADATQDSQPVATGATNASGVAHFDLPPGSYHAAITIQGRQLGSQVMDLTAGGAEVAVDARWQVVGKLEAELDAQPAPGQVLYAEVVSASGKKYHSAPFELVAEHGTQASIREAPVLMTFHDIGGVEDQLLAIQAQFKLINFGWAPFQATPDGLDIPLPRGFKGATINEKDQQVAAVAAGIGFRIPRPLPPGGATTFVGGFSVPVDAGTVTWSQDLPLGTVNSWIRLEPQPGMLVETVPADGAPAHPFGSLVDGDTGPVYNMPDITIRSGQSMAFTIRNLPTPPRWKVWMPRIIGALVVVLMIGGVCIALLMKPAPKKQADTARAARRAKLMEELVELESKASGQTMSGKDSRRRESLLVELEKLWDDAA